MKIFDVDVYMKSGNIIHIKDLTNYELKPRVSIKWQQLKETSEFLIWIDVDQIEAVISLNVREIEND